jgi:hypothetical protein
LLPTSTLSLCGQVLSELVEAAQALPDDEALHDSVVQVLLF